MASLQDAGPTIKCFTPNVVSTKSTIKNQQSKIPLYNAPNCFKYFSEFSLTFCGGFIESAFLKFLTAFFSSPFIDRKSTRLNSSHVKISYAVFCLKKKT